MKQAWKNHGALRTLDDMGRIVIPKELRDKLGIELGQPMEIFIIDDELIMIRKFGCAICGQNEATELFQGQKVCADCIRDCKTADKSSAAKRGKRT